MAYIDQHHTVGIDKIVVLKVGRNVDICPTLFGHLNQTTTRAAANGHPLHTLHSHGAVTQGLHAQHILNVAQKLLSGHRLREVSNHADTYTLVDTRLQHAIHLHTQ